MPPTSHLTRIRTALPAVHAYAYLNAGTSGPLPQPAIEAMAAAAHDAAVNGRIRFEVLFADTLPKMNQLRAAFARLLGAHPSEIALTHSTTAGINIAVWGQPWQPGDEIAITDLEHEGGVLPAALAARRLGLRLRTVDLFDCDPADAPAAVAAQLTPATRLLVISHVSWSNGARLPLAEIVAAAHAHGCKVAVDGAQSAGAIPVDAVASGADYYAVPGQKWLCGPEGIGALYVARRELEALQPTFAGFFALPLEQHDTWDYYGRMVLAPDASRYEGSTIYFPAVDGMLASLEWLEQEVGWDWAFDRIAHMQAYAQQALSQNRKLRLFTPLAAAGLVHFYLPPEAQPDQVSDALIAHGIRIRAIPHVRCLRISTGFWNTEAEIDHLSAALEEIL